MRQRATVAERSFVQSQVEWRILHVEFRVARPYLARLNTKHLFVELDALLNVSHVQGQVCFQRLHCLLAFHFILLYIHIRISECEKGYAASYISVKAHVRLFSRCGKKFESGPWAKPIGRRFRLFISKELPRIRPLLRLSHRPGRIGTLVICLPRESSLFQTKK